MKKAPGVTNISTTIYHEKSLSRQNMCPLFGAAFLNLTKMLFSYLKISVTKKKIPFRLETDIFVMFGGCPYFLNKALDKAYSKQLRKYDPDKKNT